MSLAKRLFIVLSLLLAVGMMGAALFKSWVPLNRPYNIQYVNYNGRNDVDAGFEKYLTDRKINYEITYHNVDRNPGKLSEITTKIRAMKGVDLVVSWGTTATLGVFGSYQNQSALRDIPGVFVLVTDPVASRVVPSVQNHGRNLTGSWHVAPTSNQLRAMLAHKPAAKIGILYTPSEANSLITVKEMKHQGELIGVEVIAIPFDFQDGQPVSTNASAALTELKARGCTWIYLPPDTFLGSQARSLVIPKAHALGMLTFASTEQLMLAGATFGLVATYLNLGELTGEKAEKILVDRVKPEAIPITTVKRFSHYVNLQTAKKLGVIPRPELLDDMQQVK